MFLLFVASNEIIFVLGMADKDSVKILSQSLKLSPLFHQIKLEILVNCDNKLNSYLEEHCFKIHV